MGDQPSGCGERGLSGVSLEQFPTTERTARTLRERLRDALVVRTDA